MHLTKHHGLGNDFLILLDRDDDVVVDEDIARALCDRHRGVGADGLIRVTRGDDSPFRMELHNEDGTRAEMSGNGISCLAQAIVLAGHIDDGTVRVDTDAGERVVTVEHTDQPHRHRMRVAMGTPRIAGARDEWVDDGILHALHVDVGNPHLVCHVPDPDARIDLVELGERVNEATPGGTNLELVTPGEDGSIVMLVYERGVGPTQACGTGAVAAAAAAQSWGLAPATVTVTQPGGDAVVELGEPAYLTVPVEAIARVEWPL